MYIVSIMAADVQATQGARASATWHLLCWLVWSRYVNGYHPSTINLNIFLVWYIWYIYSCKLFVSSECLDMRRDCDLTSPTEHVWAPAPASNPFEASKSKNDMSITKCWKVLQFCTIVHETSHFPIIFLMILTPINKLHEWIPSQLMIYDTDSEVTRITTLNNSTTIWLITNTNKSAVDFVLNVGEVFSAPWNFASICSTKYVVKGFEEKPPNLVPLRGRLYIKQVSRMQSLKANVIPGAPAADHR